VRLADDFDVVAVPLDEHHFDGDLPWSRAAIRETREEAHRFILVSSA
jgi:hypothetical protein